MMTRCIICKKNQAVKKNLCENCNDAYMYLEDIFNEYLEGAGGDPQIINALPDFSWFYAGYLKFGGYYNTMIKVLFHFIIDETVDTITKKDLNNFDYTTLDENDLLEILYESELLKEPTDTSEDEWEIGELSRYLSSRIREEFFLEDIEEGDASARRKEASEELFGYISIILTYLLTKKKN